MALSQADKDAIREIVQQELESFGSKILQAISVLGKQGDAVAGKLDQVLANLAALEPQPADLRPVLAAIVEQPGKAATMVLEQLAERAPRLFDERLQQLQVDQDMGPESRWHWLVEQDGLAHLPGQGSVRFARGQILDERAHLISEIRAQNVPLRKLYARELPRYGARE